jgi:hypothetical protein
MRHRSLVYALAACASVVLLGCSPDMHTGPAEQAIARPSFQAATINREAIWADGELFDVLASPATFDNPQGGFDELYKGGNGFLNGVGAISDAGPGDPSYRGGRWHVDVLKQGVDPNKYANASSAADLDPADFASTDVYFECPLLPHRGNGGR